MNTDTDSTADAIYKAQIFYAAVFAIMAYDCFTSLWREIAYIWKAKWTVIKVLYLWVRYSCLAVSTFTLVSYYASWTPSRCRESVKLVSFLPVLQVVPAHCILIARLYGVWNKDRKVFYFTVPLLACEAVIMSWISWMRTEMIPFASSTGACIPRGRTSIAIVYYVVAMLVDLILTSLTTFQCYRVQRANRGLAGIRSSTLVSAVLRQSLHYYFMITAVNIVNVAWYASHTTLNALMGPLAIITTELLALHLALALKTDFYFDEKVNYNVNSGSQGDSGEQSRTRGVHGSHASADQLEGVKTLKRNRSAVQVFEMGDMGETRV